MIGDPPPPKLTLAQWRFAMKTNPQVPAAEVDAMAALFYALQEDDEEAIRAFERDPPKAIRAFLGS